MVDPVTIGYGANKWLFDANTQFLSLFNGSDFGTKALHSTANVDYIVPVGKKFIILGFNYKGTEQYIDYDTSPDVSGTLVFHYDGHDSIPSTWIEIPASNYINVAVSGSNTQCAYWGIETTT